MLADPPYGARKATAWLGVTAKLDVGELRTGRGLHIAIARGVKSARDGLVPVKKRADGLWEVRPAVHSDFVRACDMGYAAVCAVLGGVLRPRERPSDDFSAVRDVVAELVQGRGNDSAISIASEMIAVGQPDLVDFDRILARRSHRLAASEPVAVPIPLPA